MVGERNLTEELKSLTVKELLEKALIENFGEVRSAKVVQERGVSITVEEKGRERRISCVSRGFFDVVNRVPCQSR